MGGYVYLICDPANDTFKIGVTRNLTNNRIKKLQTGNSTELHLIKTYYFQYPFRMETMLHNHFANKQELNEWYRLDINDIANFEAICEMIGNRINLLKNNPFFNKNLR